MGINVLTSAFATPPVPAMTLAGVQRGSSESASASGAGEAKPSVPPRVVFNPRSHFDASAGVFVMEFRSASSGEVERQFPDEQQLRAYENAKKIEAARNRGESVAAAVDSTPDAKAPVVAEHATRGKAETHTDAAPAKGHQPVRIEV